jgi:hypothetical protein
MLSGLSKGSMGQREQGAEEKSTAHESSEKLFDG